jgi:hypothetical protein
MIKLPITEQARKQEWRNIIIIAHNNGFPESTIQKLRTKLMNKRSRPHEAQQSQNNQKKMDQLHILWSRNTKVTNLFKHTDLHIAFRPTNTTYQQLSQRRTNNSKPSGIYQLKETNNHPLQRTHPIYKTEQPGVCVSNAHTQQ